MGRKLVSLGGSFHKYGGMLVRPQRTRRSQSEIERFHLNNWFSIPGLRGLGVLGPVFRGDFQVRGVRDIRLHCFKKAQGPYGRGLELGCNRNFLWQNIRSSSCASFAGVRQGRPDPCPRGTWWRALERDCLHRRGVCRYRHLRSHRWRM